MTVDPRVMAKRLELSNRRLVRSEFAGGRCFDLEKFRRIENSNLLRKNSEETDLFGLYPEGHSIDREGIEWEGTILQCIYLPDFCGKITAEKCNQTSITHQRLRVIGKIT
ncbi:hypothetical protein B0H17DRAFT_1129805 [Mycena rosella]|uniref:Uncharacterized protein n=1 Tax=Mycena rosella TaxID=1033263 RepID=A0AAD7DUQ6_MYCRO|nr:hypothetical protein B0H17DRAFT_1129805 [Mycena rosella]